ncbi:MAG: AEC family transporter [Deltaproteobacteria bacterium]|jgi:predicted permease|nr:AEC family transporter [Deltaproteobacteria bacterium]
MGAVLLKTAEGVLSLYIVGLLGFILAKRRFIGPEAKMLFPKLVTVVTLPPFLFVSVLRSFTRAELLHLIYGIVIPITSILLLFFLGVLYTRIFNVKKERRGLISVGSASSNTIFIGLPVNIALFGEQALPYVLLYFFANTTFFWTLGNYSLSLDGVRTPEKFSGIVAAKSILSPPMMGFALGIILIIAGKTPFKPIMDACSMVGSLTTPLALLFIGTTLAGCALSSLKPDRDLVWILLARFVLSPLVVVLLAETLVSIPTLMLKVFIIQSSLPAPANLALMSAYHGSDSAYGGLVVSISTLLSLLTIPCYMMIFNFLKM